MVAPSLISLVRSRSLAFFLISQSAMLPRDTQDIIFMNDKRGVKNGHPYKKKMKLLIGISADAVFKRNIQKAPTPI